MRPPSIVQFERVFFCSIVLGAVAAILWLLYPPIFTIPADAPPSLARMMHVVTVVTMGLGIVINLLLLYFIARRGSDVARWIFVALFAIGLVSVMRQFGSSTPFVLPQGVQILGIVMLVLRAVCVWLVFRPDAKPWFRK
jgi:hypothetical protein